MGLAFLGTVAVVGLIVRAPSLRRARRQLVIGYDATAATYLLGLLFTAGVV